MKNVTVLATNKELPMLLLECLYRVSGKEMDESSATDDDEEEDITEHPELADLFQPAKKDEEEDK